MGDLNNKAWLGKKRPDMSGENHPNKRPEIRKKISLKKSGELHHQYGIPRNFDERKVKRKTALII